VTWVLVTGNLFRLVPALLQCFFRDTRSLGAESDGLHVRAHATNTATSSKLVGAVGPAVIPAEDMATLIVPAPEAAPAPAPQAAADAQLEPGEARRSCLGPQHVAPLIAVANLLAKIGAGLSVRYFSLYFWRNLHLPPMWVMLVMVLAQLGGSMATIVAQKASEVIGRIQVCLLFRLVGVAMLAAISLTPAPLQTPQAIIPLYLLRQWFVQSPIALQKSVLNDYISKRHRAKWNALDSINTSSWAGSAVLGGLLSDRFGYLHVFLVTAAIGLIANAMYLPLAWLVAVEDRPRAGRRQPEAAAVAGSTDHNTASSEHPRSALSARLLDARTASTGRD